MELDVTGELGVAEPDAAGELGVVEPTVAGELSFGEGSRADFAETQVEINECGAGEVEVYV